MGYDRKLSPCLTCKSVRDPENCENKNCSRWRSWFLDQWEHLRQDPRLQMEQAGPQLDSINIGGMPYVLPHRAKEYLQASPCVQCLCPKERCISPCPSRRVWDHVRDEVQQ